ncbi:MAG: hypothetical protein IKU10_03525 [Clostridia bacterium]|nr:hypothetical protein [Clostridia bacterium]
MKRACSLLLVLVVCVGLLACFATQIYAVAPVAVTIGLGSAQGLAGDVIGLDVNISADSGVLAFELNVEVPTDYLEPATIREPNGKETYFSIGELPDYLAISTTKGLVSLPNQKKGLTLNVAGTEGLWEAGTVCTLYFRVIRALPSQGIELPVTVPKCIHCEGKKIPFDITAENGRVTPAKPISSTASSKPSLVSIWPTFSKPEWKTSSVTAKPASSAPARSTATVSKPKNTSSKTRKASKPSAKKSNSQQQDKSGFGSDQSPSSVESDQLILSSVPQITQTSNEVNSINTTIIIVLAVAVMIIVVFGVIIVVLLIRRKQ